jgi:hypothetical protein
MNVEPIDVLADYTRTVFGSWHVEVAASSGARRSADAESMEGIFGMVLDFLTEIANEARRPCATVHALDGDVEAFLALAEEHDLASMTAETIERTPGGTGDR